ncbi:uncharacterized protein BJ212DRAFT_1477547 [Suillus subaureus]|uniref:Zn(2)-C6 fungal-type domain-containing protein n=1 Tax=Suillus subaureus TaxID=48587 RepID=A0A9P7EHP3_9AGAM|nr:uncharacterized protein BJ212DRAFT_1477547 [Suillus subaureus]KAG1821699.1 hypothetical protein BJ212DRAFT_1477547 [Suillus subaureus]
MPPFTLSMLDSYSSPPPSPGLEERSEELPQETPVTLVLHTWSMVIATFVACAETRPGLKQELLEEIEDWLREWNCVSTAMAASSDKVCAAGVALDLDEGKVKLLAETTKWAGVAQKTISDWKKRAEGLMAATADTHAGKAPAVTAAEDRDMGVLCPGGRMSTPKCDRCTAHGIVCNGTLGTRCPSCVHLHQACSFAKCKAIPGAPRSRKVTHSGKATAPAPTITTADDADTSGELEVEIWEVLPPQKKVIHPSRPLPARAGNGDMQVRELEEELAHVRTESGRLEWENEGLRASNMRYSKFILNMRQHSCGQEAELLLMSNKLYTMLDDWSVIEREMGDVLREQ